MLHLGGEDCLYPRAARPESYQGRFRGAPPVTLPGADSSGFIPRLEPTIAIAGLGGPFHDSDDGSPDSNVNGYHPGFDSRPRGSDSDVGGFDDSSDDDRGSRDSNCNRYHLGMDACHGAIFIGTGGVAVPRHHEKLKSLVVGSLSLVDSEVLVATPVEHPAGGDGRNERCGTP